MKELPGYPVQNSPSGSLLSWGGGLSTGGNSICYCVNGMPQKDTLDSAAYTCMLVSYRRLSPLFQFSVWCYSCIYLSGEGYTQGFVIKGINHTGQIFLTRPSVSSCVRHGCNPLIRFSSEWGPLWWGHLSEQGSVTRGLTILHKSFLKSLY